MFCKKKDINLNLNCRQGNDFITQTFKIIYKDERFRLTSALRAENIRLYK